MGNWKWRTLWRIPFDRVPKVQGSYTGPKLSGKRTGQNRDRPRKCTGYFRNCIFSPELPKNRQLFSIYLSSINKGPHVGQPVFLALFALFASAGVSPPSSKKNKNPSKTQGCPMRSSSAGAEMLADKEKSAENTLCILKGFDAV